MQRFLIAALTGLTFCTFAFAQVPRVVINEFVYDDSLTDDREFVELYNADTVPVDISNWVLEAGDATTFPNNNPDYTIPAGTVLQPGEFYVIGAATVPNVDLVVGVNDLWENDQEWIALRMPNGTVVDAVIYEANKGTTGFPAEVFEGRGVWGNYTSIEGGTSTDDTNQSIARYLDGRDTNNNGYDFGLLPRTPGTTNRVESPPTFPVFDNFESYNVGDPFPGLTGSFRIPRVIDPTTVSAINPNAIPLSPDGGKALLLWDWAGGGNQSATDYIFQNRAGYELYIYVDPTLRPGTERESWAIGVLGAAETFYNLPFGTSPVACGITGIAWVFHRDATRAFLRLVDTTGGGDSNLHWTILGEIDLTGHSAGWHRLRLQVNGSVVRGVFGGAYGSLRDGTHLVGNTQAGLVGTFYTGYREFIVDNSTTNPARVDALTLFLPVPGDVDGSGCTNDVDVGAVLVALGQTGAGLLEDLNNDGRVDNDDLSITLSNFAAGC